MLPGWSATPSADTREGLFTSSEPAALDGAAAHQYAILDAMDVPVTSGADALTERAPALVVDALVGAVDPTQVLTLALPKTGLAPHDWPVVLADISAPAGVYDALDIPYDDPFGPDYWIDLARARA